ncbi:tRNA cyclic N6-threonylcarbamoyladenosine(37) synthase TcdA [Luteibacter pinisoli]|uniref:tRNA cyclic N6-threonylcarbamoyladenosine(37) synthase TcdA n=1 Tax=Luteibacter pinisoli TaxID=2589080 RepID=A0A4Y5Z578_9GAMM|nr:tRNA cyclic N6-threonylcarbamoyladenosine(37) synthase TcdA [Luteibacter pinisoli]QDE40264.1 tRNA cyclic N6-threonylcarbamoyladenosine(37) synthase TcdA [Luteibacter pinisoli]
MHTQIPTESHVSTAQAERFAGIERLYGRGTLDRLAHAHVCVIGIGGVGSWAAEALARSGIGRLTLIDGDDVCLSNTNRQLHALEGQYGRPKVGVIAERAHAINPTIRLEAMERFLTPSTLDELLDRNYDVVIDACDAMKVKLETIVWCRRRKVPLVTVGAAGGRTDPTQIRVRDLSRTEHDAMLSMIRKRLRQEYNFPRNPDRFFGVSAVYSMQNVQYPQADGSVCGVRPAGSDPLKLDCGGGLGAATHVTGAFAFAAVGKALEKLTQAKKA